MEKHQIPITCDAFAVNGFRNFQKERNDGLHENWGLETLLVHPPRHLWPRVAQKIVFEGNRGIGFVPTTKKASWWWLLGEVVVDWLDVPAGSLLYEDLNGKLLPTCTDIRVVYYDAYNHPQGDQKQSECHQSDAETPPPI